MGGPWRRIPCSRIAGCPATVVAVTGGARSWLTTCCIVVAAPLVGCGCTGAATPPGWAGVPAAVGCCCAAEKGKPDASTVPTQSKHNTHALVTADTKHAQGSFPSCFKSPELTHPFFVQHRMCRNKRTKGRKKPDTKETWKTVSFLVVVQKLTECLRLFLSRTWVGHAMWHATKVTNCDAKNSALWAGCSDDVLSRSNLSLGQTRAPASVSLKFHW